MLMSRRGKVVDVNKGRGKDFLAETEDTESKRMETVGEVARHYGMSSCRPPNVEGWREKSTVKRKSKKLDVEDGDR